MDTATTILIVLATIVTEKLLERLARDAKRIQVRWKNERQKIEDENKNLS